LTRGERAWLLVLGSVATASHLSHLPVIFALLVLVLLLRAGWRAAVRVAAPLAGAVALLLATNLIGHGRLAISPYGSTFLLARLIADGPAARTIATRCPESDWYLCAFAGRLPSNSDEFLWLADSPVNRTPTGEPIFLGGKRLAPEASAIIAETLRREPWAVIQGGLGNFLWQMRRTRIGDTLGAEHLDKAVRPRLVQAFPASAVQGYDNSLQSAGQLRPLALSIAWLHPWLLVLATPFLLLAWRRAHVARDARALGLLLCILVGVTGNALAAGALSMPHDRYQARIAWLLPMAAVLFWRRPEPAPPVTG